MSETFDRNGNPIELEEFSELFSNKQYQRVKRTTLLNGTLISTVWLGIAHGHGPNGPLIFETMVFPSESDRSFEEEQYRFSSEEEAVIHHEYLIEGHEIKKKKEKTLDEVRWKDIIEED